MKKRSLCLGLIAVATALASGCAREKWSHADAVPKAPALVAHQYADPDLPGRLEEATILNRIDASEIERAIDALGGKAPAITPRYDVINHRLIYYTTDGKGLPIKASGLVSVPVKAPGRRATTRSLLKWQSSWPRLATSSWLPTMSATACRAARCTRICWRILPLQPFWTC
jgi:hypothetical protein